jgi:prenylcysteine oxidase / farnesylcysteine lyase
VQNVVKKFLSFYTSDSPSWENISNLADAFDWAAIINTTTEEYLQTQGVSLKYIGEVVEAATRVNYGQVRKIHKISTTILSEYLCVEC